MLRLPIDSAANNEAGQSSPSSLLFGRSTRPRFSQGLANGNYQQTSATPRACCEIHRPRSFFPFIPPQSNVLTPNVRTFEVASILCREVGNLSQLKRRACILLTLFVGIRWVEANGFARKPRDLGIEMPQDVCCYHVHP